MRDPADVHRLIRDELNSWHSDVRTSTLEPVGAVLDGAADRIDDLRPGGSDAERRFDLAGRLDEHVLDPIRRTLAEHDVLVGVPLSLLEILHRIRTRVESLPERTDRPEHPDLFESDPGDAAVTHLRKALVRVTRRFGSRSANDGEAAPLPVRSIPLRTLALFHLVERFGVREIDAVLGHRSRSSAALARVERALTDLCHALLEIPAQDVRASDTLSAEEAARRASNVLRSAARTIERLDAPADPRREWFEDLRTAGTFMAHGRTPDDDAIRRRFSALARHADDWAAWQRQFTERLSFCRQLVATRADLHRTGRSTGSDVIEVTDAVANVFDRIARVIRKAEADIPVAALADQTLDASAWLSDTEGRLVSELERGLDDGVSARTLTSGVRAVVIALRSDSEHTRERRGSTFLVHPLSEADVESIDPRSDPVTLDLGEILDQGLAALLDPEFETRVIETLEPAVDIVQEASELQEIIRYNLRAADTRSRDGSEEDEFSPAEIVRTGLVRAAEAAELKADRIRRCGESLERLIGSETDAAWTRIHDRARIQRQMEGAVMDIQHEVDTRLRQLSSRVRSGWSTIAAFVRGRALRSFVLARRAVRRGRKAVGAVTDMETGYHETITALSSLEDVLERVPPIYRRLFAFTPVTDADLLVGREQDLAFLKKHVALWSVGVPQALILHGSPSSGRTSLLNVLEQEIGVEHSVVRLKLPPTVDSESELATLVASALEITDPVASSLAHLGEHLLSEPRPESARLVIVEQIGSLMMRTIGGFDLISEFLALASRTDSRRLWICTMSESGWKALDAARPDATALTVSRTLSPIDRPQLERLVMSRHRRSGVPLEFLVPVDPSPILTRRLNRARRREQKQAVLREAWFDRLFAVAGQDIMMALFYWLRSVEMTESEDRLLVNWFRPVRFDFLSTFSLDQAFALLAMLERGSITVAGHAETNLLSFGESRRILESLANALLIEPLGETSSSSRFQSTVVREQVPYRIRPLVVHPVIRFLRERNIVH